MRGQLSTGTQEQVRALKRITRKVCRGYGVPREAPGRRQVLRELVTAMRKVARTFARTSEGAKELLEGLVVAEVGGVDETLLAEIRGDLARRLTKRRTA